MTHKQLVEIAYRWVLKNCSVGIAFKELVATGGECADVIAFGAWEHSVLVEVKVSRSDFLADRKKPFRKNPELGMGKQRFYCCPDGMIKKEDLPEGWGLIYVYEGKKARTVYSPYTGNIGERLGGFVNRNKEAERSVMYSALRRLMIKGYMKHIYDKDYIRADAKMVISKNDPSIKQINLL